MSSGILTGVFSSINKVASQLKEAARLSVQENDYAIIDMNTENLFAGKNSQNQRLDDIAGGYADKTIEYKKAKGQPYDRVTLKDTGDFYEGFFVKDAKLGWEISSKDSKTEKLMDDWGDDIFGNTPEDEREINEEYILPDLLEHALDNMEL